MAVKLTTYTKWLSRCCLYNLLH